MASYELDSIGVEFFVALFTAIVFVVIAFRLALTVFDFFGIRPR